MGIEGFHDRRARRLDGYCLQFGIFLVSHKEAFVIVTLVVLKDANELEENALEKMRFLVRSKLVMLTEHQLSPPRNQDRSAANREL